MNYFETFIGSITVAEFLMGFESMDGAIENIIDNWPWDCEIPDNFDEVIRAYCIDKIS